MSKQGCPAGRPRRRLVGRGVRICNVQIARYVLGFMIMGVTYGCLTVYGPWTDPSRRGWQEAVRSGVVFASLMGAWALVRARRSRRDP